MKKIAVMVSGIDSFISYRLAKKERVDCEIIPIYVHCGHDYAEKELKALMKLIPELTVVHTTLVSVKLDNVPTIDKQEIFGRNLLIAFYGSLLGDEVWISALETEMSVFAVPDKRPEFFSLTSALLTLVMKNKRNETIIKTPVSEYTKSDLIAMALDKGLVTKDELKTIPSCYHPTLHSCGECGTCAKRAIAFVNNGIEEETSTNPFESKYMLARLADMLYEKRSEEYSGRYTKKRIEETLKAFRIKNITIPS